MNKKTEKVVKRILILIIILLIIIINYILFHSEISLKMKELKLKNQLSKLEYDIVIEENHDRNVYFDSETGLLDVRMFGGYANYYHSILINSKTKQQIEVIYKYLYHKYDFDKDTLSVEISSISDQAIESYAQKYGKSKDLLSVKDFVNERYKDYKIKSIKYND